MTNRKAIYDQLDVLAFWGVMLAKETHPIFKELVDLKLATKDYFGNQKYRFTITDLGKQKAAKL